MYIIKVFVGVQYIGPKGEMQEFLEGVADADDVPTYVKEHPFGQPAITSSHPNWDYYAKIIREEEASGSNYSDYERSYNYSDYDSA